MKATIPEGTRPMRDMTVLLNVAMGGNVCGGKTPRDGFYDMVVYSMFLASELEHVFWVPKLSTLFRDRILTMHFCA
ncbi:hypothetical protein E4U14_005940 [Claviceps sp. LM454 group G7]|nr:hypothetical protein E4U14_005940 [Claviceps sp. LM454 group G7]